MFKKTNAGDQLLIAVKLSKVSEISRLVALGVNVDSRIDKSGKTALHYAAYKGQLSAVKALAEAGADLDITDENGVTPLQRAVVDGHSDVVKSLLKAGASFDKTDETGNTALHEAAWNGYSKCVELLVTAKCNVNIHNQTGYTSLHLAAQNGHCKTLQVLLHAGANPLAKNNYGDTPLHIAVRYGHVKACDTLFATKINTSEQNNDGNTPLHIAASMGHEKLVEMLLRAGSLIGVRNNVGDTARDLAVQDGFRRIAQLLTPVKGDTLKKKEKKEKKRPRSVDVSHLYSETTVSIPTTLGTQLWIPIPADTDLSVSKKSWHKRDVSEDVSWTSKKEQGDRQKTAAKPKQLTIKYDEMCSIEREYSRFLKKRNEASRRRLFRKSRSKSSLKSEENRMCSDPVLNMTPKKSALRGDKGKQNGAQSRDDLEVGIQQKKNKNKKEKGFLGLFRSASDPDIHTSSKKNSFFGKKHRRDQPPSGKVLENGLSRIREDEEVKEKGEIEETKERKAKGKSERKKREKTDEITGAKVGTETNKNIAGDDLKKQERKERKKGKEKKHSIRNDKEHSESNCSLCEEQTKKQKEKMYSKESKHKQHRPKSEEKHSRDKHDSGKADLKEEDRKPRSKKDKTEDDREHRKKKHHRDKGKAKDKTDKDKHVDKATDKQLQVTGVNSVPGPCNQAQCSMCQASLSRLEAWQERCTSEIDSARRKLEHRLQRLEKKLEEQQSDESLLKDKETREKEYDRVVGRVSDQCQEISKSFKETSVDVKGEIRRLIKDGLGRLEFKLNQVAAGYNMGIHNTDGEDRCNPALGRNCAMDRRILRPRSRSSPHLGRTPCDDCSRVSDPRSRISPPPSPAVRNPSAVNSRVRVSQSDAMERLVESGGQEEGHKLDGTFAAIRVQDQRHAQEVDRWWREKADEEQRVLYARICELEQMLMMSRSGGAYFV